MGKGQQTINFPSSAENLDCRLWKWLSFFRFCVAHCDMLQCAVFCKCMKTKKDVKVNEKESVGFLKWRKKEESVLHKHKKVFWTTEKVNQMLFWSPFVFSPSFEVRSIQTSFYTLYLRILTLIKCTTTEKKERKKHVELKDERKQRSSHILKLNDYTKNLDFVQETL